LCGESESAIFRTKRQVVLETTENSRLRRGTATTTTAAVVSSSGSGGGGSSSVVGINTTVIPPLLGSPSVSLPSSTSSRYSHGVVIRNNGAGSDWEDIELSDDKQHTQLHRRSDNKQQKQSYETQKKNQERKKKKSSRMKTWRERNQRMKLIRYGLMAVLVFVMWQYSSQGAEVTTEKSGGSNGNNNNNVDDGVSLSLRKLNQKEPYFFRASEAQVCIIPTITIEKTSRSVSLSSLTRACDHFRQKMTL